MNLKHDFRIVALLAVRNEGLYLKRCLEHLYQQGIETCIIDNESNDETLDIAHYFLDRGVIRIVSFPYRGFYDWRGLLHIKEQMALEISAEWFIHQDADEIREAPAPFRNLREGIEAADYSGYNAINFDEFVFLPTSISDNHVGGDYRKSMRYYYFFEPAPLRQVKAWKKQHQKVEIAGSAGHDISFQGRRIYPISFVMRHYIGLSQEHLRSKYQGRVYSDYEVNELGWHRVRRKWQEGMLILPDISCLKQIIDEGIPLDKSSPSGRHLFTFG